MQGGVVIVQKEVMELLREKKRPMTTSEVAHSLHIGMNSASRKLNQLAEYKFVTKIPKRTLMGTQFHRVYKYSIGVKKR